MTLLIFLIKTIQLFISQENIIWLRIIILAVDKNDALLPQPSGKT